MLELLTYIFFGFIWYQFIAIFGISIGLHRSLCHKQVELSKVYEVFALFLVTLTGARSPLGWIGAHRIHHATADTVDDPHSPDIKGFWKVLFNRWTCKSIPRKHIKDELKNSRIMFFHQYWKHIHLSAALIALLIGIDVFLIFIAVPFILGFLGYGFFNAAGHKDFRPRTNKWINILSAGEGYHDIHHKNPKQVRLNRYDLAGFILETLNKRSFFMRANYSRKNRKELPAVCVVKDIEVDTEALIAYCHKQKLFDTEKYKDINVIQYPLVKGKNIPASHFNTKRGMQDFTAANSYCKEKFFKEDGAPFLQGKKYKQLYLTEFDSTKRSGNVSYDKTTIFQRSKRLDPDHPSYLPEADEYNYGIRNELVQGEIKKVLNCFKAPLARVRFANLAPNFKIKPHIDYDPSYITRYHIPLITNKDCLMCVIDRNGNKITEHFKNDGRVYFLNTGLKHWAENNSREDRIHLIVDTKNQQDLQY